MQKEELPLNYATKKAPQHQYNGPSQRRQDGVKQQEVPTKSQDSGESKCFACGETNHNFKACKFKRYKCTTCSRFGHIKKACKAKRKQNQHFLETNDEEANNDDFSDSLYNLFKLEDRFIDRKKPNPYSIKLGIEDVYLQFEVDTGASLSVIPDRIVKIYFAHLLLKKCNTTLSSYDGKKIKPLGFLTLSISYKKANIKTDFLVIKSAGSPLLGRDLIDKLGIKLCTPNNDVIYSMPNNSKCLNNLNLLSKYGNLFQNELGRFSKAEISLAVASNTKLIFCKPYNIPFAYREKVEQEPLEKIGAIRKVDTKNGVHL